MKDMIQFIVNIELFYCLLDVGILDFFGKKILKRKYASKVITTVLLLITSVIIYMLTLPQTYSGLSNIMSLMVMVSYIYILFDGTQKKKLTIPLLYYMLSGVVTLVVVSLAALIFNLDATYFLTHSLSRMMITLLIKMLTFLVVFYIFGLFSGILSTYKKVRNTLIYIFGIMLVLFLLFDFMFLDNSMSKNSFAITMSLVFFILILTITILLFKYFDSTEKKNRTAAMLREMTIKNQSYIDITDQYIALTKIKHDFRNHLITIKTLINQNNVEAIKYIHKLENLSALNTYVNTNNDVLNAILNSKISEYQDIDFRIRFEESNFDIPYDTTTIIIGNAIDNAIEAVKKLKKEDREINVILIENKMNIKIGISNPYAVEPFISNDILYSSKLPNRVGLGMKNMEEAVSSLGGEIRYKAEDGIFTLTIIIKK